MNTKLKAENMEFDEYGSLSYVSPKMPVVYGPVQSRRLGLAVGVNILGSGAKVCSFDCPYCDLGQTSMRLNKLKSTTQFPTPDEIFEALKIGFQEAHQRPERIEAISIAGNGEPTMHPLFSEVIDVVLKARDLYLPGVRVVVFTNGTTLDQRRVVDALNRVDERMLKLDAGNDEIMKQINAPLVRTSVSKIISGARQLKDVVAQCFFVQGTVNNTTDEAIEEWIEVIGLVKPKAVHIHGMNRVPAARGLKAADEDTLYIIASKLERRTQIKSLVYP